MHMSNVPLGCAFMLKINEGFYFAIKEYHPHETLILFFKDFLAVKWLHRVSLLTTVRNRGNKG